MELDLVENRIEVENLFEDSFEEDLGVDVKNGLLNSAKRLPCKYFYDSVGSRLFEKICKLPEYYITRTEMSILNQQAKEMISGFKGGDLVELGSGANWKIRCLLDAIDPTHRTKTRYIPVDVSESALLEASYELLEIYPWLKIKGIIADFTQNFQSIATERPLTILFFGSSIGNFTEEESVRFLSSVSEVMKTNDRFVLAVDMLKQKELLEKAYNDEQGITSQFNKNILKVLNRELDADFKLDHFDHHAFFNQQHKRIEMHLKAKKDMVAEIRALDLKVRLYEGETIHTENCRKFSTQCIEDMASSSGLEINRRFTDPNQLFSLVEMVKS